MNGDSPVFVDTNVLVYAYDESDLQKREIAQELLLRLVDEDRFRSSTQIFQEFYVTVTRKVKQPMTPDQALGILDDLSQWPHIEISYSSIRDAIRLSAESVISLWDALVVVAARQSGAAVLYTEDLNHGQQIQGVEIVNPFVI